MQFRPGWKLSLFFVLLLPCLVFLGYWQLQRAGEKRQVLQQIASQRSGSPMTFEQLRQVVDPAYTQLRLRGSYQQDKVILLDNQLYQGRFGYEVVQPFEIVQPFADAGGDVVLVSRGWVAGSLRREVLPQIETVSGVVDLVGEVYVPLGEAFTLADTDLPRGWPKRVQVLDPGALASALGEDVYPHVIRLQSGSNTALTAHWQDINVQPEKHTAYAVQWFAMSLALVILYAGVAMGFIVSKNKAGR